MCCFFNSFRRRRNCCNFSSWERCCMCNCNRNCSCGSGTGFGQSRNIFDQFAGDWNQSNSCCEQTARCCQ